MQALVVVKWPAFVPSSSIIRVRTRSTSKSYFRLIEYTDRNFDWGRSILKLSSVNFVKCVCKVVFIKK